MNRAAWPALVGSILILTAGAARGDDFPGISVDPPETDAWIQVQQNAASLVWMRRTGRPDLSMGVALLTQRMDRGFASHDAFVDWVRSRKEANPDPERFRLVDNRVAPAGGGLPTCARYATVIEDRTATGPGEPDLRLQVTGLACLHPDHPRRYYDIQYSARMPAGVPLPAELAREGRAFVESARFRTPPEDGDWSLGEGAPAVATRESA